MTAVDWSRPIEAVSVTGEIIPARWRWRDDAGDELGVRFVTSEAFGWPFRDNGEPREPFDGTVWRIRNVHPTTPERDPALWDRMVALVRLYAQDRGTFITDEAWKETLAIVADLSKPVDPDLQAAKEIAQEYGLLPVNQPDAQDRALAAILQAMRHARTPTPEVSHVG